MKTVTEIYKDGQVTEKVEGEVEHTKISVEGYQDLWIRRRTDRTDRAEIMTDDPAYIEALTRLAKENPDIISALTEPEEGGALFGAGRELIINVVPATGCLEFWVEKYVPDKD